VLTLLATHLAVLALLTVTLGPQLIERIARGDGRALRSAYDAHAGRVLALALRIVRSRAEAEDVVQDTFLEVWRRAPEYDATRGELSSWILSMARSRCIDRIRRARVRARHAQQVHHVSPDFADQLEER
jgi:RNA polymerase sigma-70 factor (ECF subfamily)